MLEAMASGLPIVASRMPAHADLVDHGETGFMCSTQAEYESAIVELQDNEANHRMGEASKALMCAKVGTWDDCAERYFTVYNDLLGAAT